MSYGQLILDPSPFVLERVGEIAVVGILFWFALHILYEKGLLGSWPPSRRSVRIGVWLFLLYPLIGPVGLAVLVLLISSVIPATEPLAIPIVDFLYLCEDLFIVLLASLVYLRELRWCWSGYGAAGVMIVISATFSAGVIFVSLGLALGTAYAGLELGDLGWGVACFGFICCGRDTLEQKTKNEPERVVVMGHSRIEVATRTTYNVIIPLVRSIRVERDESALTVLKSLLCMDSGLERLLSSACRALGFDQRDLISVADTESASVVLQNVDAEWGNFSRIELIVLSALSAAWIVVVPFAAWAFITEPLPRSSALYVLLLLAVVLLPVGIVGLLSQRENLKPDMDYYLGRRHDEPFAFTRGEFEKRRLLDVLVVVAMLAGATCVTLAALVLGISPSGLLVLVHLSAVYLLGLVLLAFDAFVRGRRPSTEETLAFIRRKLLYEASQIANETDEDA